jgi:hypothetical protein
MVATENPAPLAAGRASDTFCLAAERSEDSQALYKLQARTLNSFSVSTRCIEAFDPGSVSGASAFLFAPYLDKVTAEERGVLSASRLRCGEDAENRFSELLPSIGALSWLRAQGVHPDALSLPDLPCAASIIFSDHAPLFEFADEAAEEPTSKALIFLERSGFGEPVDLVAWTLKPRPRLASWLGSSVLGADLLDAVWRLAERGALPIWRSPLGWLRAHRDGVVIVDGSSAAVALRAAGGPFMAEDFAHAAELRRLLRPPEPSILTPLSRSTKARRAA